MRKAIVFLLLLSVLFVGVSCHKHTFSDQWSSDANSHWHAATCNHDVTADSAAHTWDNGTITKEPTCTEEGVRTFTCTVCKATRTESVAASGHSYVKGICTGCGDSLLEGEWKIDMKATLDVLIDLYLAEEYSPEEIAANRDMYYEMALVEFATRIEDSDMTDAFTVGFSGTNCTMTFNGTGIVCQYSISDANELNLTYQGETITLGAFDENYTKLTCAEDSEFGGMVLSKNPGLLPRMVWSELYSRNPSAENVKALIAEGADVNVGRGYDGESALGYAIEEDYLDIAVALIEAGADVNERIYDMPLLAYAIEEDYSDIALALIKAGADINEKIFDMPLLAYAIEEEYSDIALALIKAGADINEKIYDMPLLAYAIEEDYSDIAIALIEAGADVNAKDEEGRTALWLELWNRKDASAEVIKDLIAHGADANAKDGEGETALMYAFRRCTNEVKLALIEAGADVNAKDGEGRTVLYYELRENKDASFDVVKALVEKGIDVNACQIREGLSAKEYAAEYCSAEIAALL